MLCFSIVSRHCVVSTFLVCSKMVRWCSAALGVLTKISQSCYPNSAECTKNLLLLNWSTTQHWQRHPTAVPTPTPPPRSTQAASANWHFLLSFALYQPISNLLIGAGAHVWIQGNHYLLTDLCRPPVNGSSPPPSIHWQVSGVCVVAEARACSCGHCN